MTVLLYQTKICSALKARGAVSLHIVVQWSFHVLSQLHIHIHILRFLSILQALVAKRPRAVRQVCPALVGVSR